MPSHQPQSYLRQLGAPVIEKSVETGLHTITRRYLANNAVLRGRSPLNEPNLYELERAFGTTDPEFDTAKGAQFTAYLVDQRAEPAKEGTDAVITRVFQELNTAIGDDGRFIPTQIGEPTVISGFSDKLDPSLNRTEIQIRYIVLNPFIANDDDSNPLSSNALSITYSDKTLLCYKESIESKGVFSVITRTFGDGIISKTVKNNNFGTLGSTQIITYTSIGRPATDFITSPPIDSVFLETSSQERDGTTVFTTSFVSGTGYISISESYKYRNEGENQQGSPSGNKDWALKITQVRALNIEPTTLTVKAGEPPAFRTDISKRADDQYIVYDATFVQGEGEISRTTSKGIAALPGSQSVSIRSINVEPATLADSITLSKGVSKADGYTLYDYEYLIGMDLTSGLLTTYNDIVQVTRAGTVEIAHESLASGSGESELPFRYPYLKTVPPNTFRKQCIVEIYLADDTTLSSFTSIPAIAFNLEDYSVGVMFKSVHFSLLGIEKGNLITANVYSRRTEANHSTMRGYYVPNATFNNYEFREEYAAALNDNGDSIIGQSLWNQIYRKYRFDEGFKTTKPPESGVYSVNVDPIFSDADGKQYYRVTIYRFP
jgi:hypothetical protein